MGILNKGFAPDREDQFPGMANNGGGNNGARAKFLRIPQAMPGQLGLLSQQLAAGFGTPTAAMPDGTDPNSTGQVPVGVTAESFRQYLNNIYSPMRIQTNQQFGQRRGNGNGNGNGNGGKNNGGLTPEELARLQREAPPSFKHFYYVGRT